MERQGRRFALTALGVGVIWFICVVVLGPWLIRSGYSGRLIPTLNDVFIGRDVHPVDFYLGAWWSVALAASGAMVLTMAGAAGWILAPDARRNLVDRLLGAADGLTPSGIVKVSMAAGLAAGLAEASYAAIRNEVTHRPAALYHIEMWWMAPLSAAVAALAIGIVLALLALGGRRRLGLRLAVGVFGFLIIHSVMQSEGIPLYPAAEVVLSLGLATALSRLVMARERQALRVVGRAGLLVAVGMVTLGSTAWMLLPASVEARALRSVSVAAQGLPNILIIIIDTARAANFSLHGYERATSPTLDDWSSSGIVFDRAVATSSWTLPSHASLFTGQANHVLDVGVYTGLSESYTTLAEALSEVGYHTGGFAANPSYTTSASGLAQGFARYEDRPWGLRQVLHSSWLSRLIFAPWATRLFPSMVLRHTPGDHITDHFLTWAQERNDERPFFAFLNYFEAHEPYTMVPPDQAGQFGAIPNEYWWDFLDRYYTLGDTSGVDLWVNRYDASIAYVDREIGRIRTWLTESGALDNTIVIVTSDHGEMWGEQGELGHAESLFAPVVHVPMLVSFPGGVPQGVRLDDPVSLADVPRTIFDLLPMEAPPEFGGASMAPLWSETRDSTPRYALAELSPSEAGQLRTPLLLLGPMKSLVDDRFQYIRYGDDSEQLFDLDLDYAQLRNLVDDPAHTDDLSRFRRALDSLGGHW